MVASIDVISFVDEIGIYPNPSNGNFSLEIRGQNIVKELILDLLDAQGRLIDTRAVTFNSYVKELYQMPTLSNGIYFIRLQSEDEVSTIKINVIE